MEEYQAQSQNSSENPTDSLLPLSEAARRFGFSAGHLNLLARTGKLKAVKLGRNWYTTEAAVKEYLYATRNQVQVNVISQKPELQKPAEGSGEEDGGEKEQPLPPPPTPQEEPRSLGLLRQIFEQAQWHGLQILTILCLSAIIFGIAVGSIGRLNKIELGVDQVANAINLVEKSLFLKLKGLISGFQKNPRLDQTTVTSSERPQLSINYDSSKRLELSVLPSGDAQISASQGRLIFLNNVTVTKELTAPNIIYKVLGVPGRIRVSEGQTPVVDIAPDYAGQISITTLGTITTGTWQGNTIEIAYGGTGLSSIGTANQLLGVNESGTGLEYKTLSGTDNQVEVSNASGSITLSLPQDIHTGAAPTFLGIYLSGLNQGSVLFAGTSGEISQNNSQLFWDDSNYRLGIGTSSPSAVLTIRAYSTSSIPLEIYTSDGIRRIYVDEGGNFHVSQNYPTRDSGQLYVERESSGTPDNFSTHAILVGGEGAGIGYNPISNFLFINNGTVLIQRPNNVGILTVKNNNVGINTSSPLDLFHVNSTSPFLVTSAGSVGIGITSPQSKLDVAGGVAIGSYAGSSAAPTNGLIVSGRLGLGTSSPSYTLDVSGSGIVARFSGRVIGGEAVNDNEFVTLAQVLGGSASYWGRNSSGYLYPLAAGDDIVKNTSGDLGLSSSPWDNLYVNNIQAGTGTLTIGAFTLGGAVTGNLTLSGHILPGADNTYDLGSATQRWRDLYFGLKI